MHYIAPPPPPGLGPLCSWLNCSAFFSYLALYLSSSIAFLASAYSLAISNLSYSVFPLSTSLGNFSALEQAILGQDLPSPGFFGIELSLLLLCLFDHQCLRKTLIETSLLLRCCHIKGQPTTAWLCNGTSDLGNGGKRNC